MNTITVTFDVPDLIDPTLVDPYDVVDDVIDIYNEWARANNRPEMAHETLTAEWD